MVYFALVILALSIFIIYRSSEWLIRYSISLSRILGISTFVIGFILVSLSTSLPEIFVTILSVLANNSELGIGNILGSNLFDINVIIGITTLACGTIFLKRKETIHMIELLLITSAITLVMLFLPSFGKIHGVILLLLYSYVLVKLYRGGRVEKEIYEEEIPILPKEKGFLSFFRRESKAPILLKFFISVAVLLAGTQLLVASSLEIARLAGFTAAFVGATLVAFGTSIPELSVTLAAVRKKHYALAMGDLVGSAVTNITLVMGILSLLNGFPVNVAEISSMLIFLIFSSLFTLLILWRFKRITKIEGIILLLIYAAFIAGELGLFAFA